MGRRGLILEAHHPTHIEGTRLTLEQAERLLAGNPVPEADPDDVRREKASVEGIIRKMGKEAGVKEEELRGRGQRRRVSEAKGKIALFLRREMGLSMAEIAINLGVGTSAIAMAIRKGERGKKV